MNSLTSLRDWLRDQAHAFTRYQSPLDTLEELPPPLCDVPTCPQTATMHIATHVCMAQAGSNIFCDEHCGTIIDFWSSTVAANRFIYCPVCKASLHQVTDLITEVSPL